MELLAHYLRHLPRATRESGTSCLGSVRAMGCVTIEICLYLGQQSFLFQEAFRAFQTTDQLPTFLEVRSRAELRTLRIMLSFVYRFVNTQYACSWEIPGTTLLSASGFA